MQVKLLLEQQDMQHLTPQFSGSGGTEQLMGH